ncbi:retropepsin-like aspartic protease, partial [Acidisphaera rubrifaciens]|uniref:retropepsin-like aspartic protease n=1 Tax=Acidisphaera rubrifaciens TaxID=50715 RepID=UPI0006624F6E
MAGPMRRFGGALAVALFATAVATSSAGGTCRFDPAVELRLPPAPGPLVIPATLDARPVRLVLDSGAERSLLSAAAVARLGLRLDPWTATGLRGIGGLTRHRDAQVGTLRIGALGLSRPLGPIRSLPVVPALPGGRIDGLLGADLMGSLDIEVTGGGLRVVLYRADGCDAATAGAALPRAAPWAAAALP